MEISSNYLSDELVHRNRCSMLNSLHGSVTLRHLTWGHLLIRLPAITLSRKTSGSHNFSSASQFTEIIKLQKYVHICSFKSIQTNG